MATLSDLRAKYPQYDDMDDTAFADAFYKKFYSDMPRDQFDTKLGISAEPTRKDQAAKGLNDYYSRGIFAGENNPLGAIARSLDSATTGSQNAMSFGFADEAAGMLPGTTIEEQRGRAEALAESNPVANVVGNVAGAMVQGGGLVKAGLSPTAHAINAGWRLPMVAATSGVEGAALGALHGAGAGETSGDRASKAKDGALVGGALGFATPLVVSGASKLAEKAISPFRTAPERLSAANVLEQEGIPISAGQKTGSDWLRYRESELGGAKAANLMEDQGKAFTRAAMRKAGQDTLADADSMASLNSRLSQQFEDISSRNALRIDQSVVDDMNNAGREYARLLPSDQKSIFNSLGDDIIEKFKAGNGSMPGGEYQTIRSRLSRMAQSYRNRDPEFSGAIRGLRDALDSGMERSINPADAGLWKELRRQWGNKKVLENAIASAGGEDAGMGIISPARLRMAASTGNRGGYARGEGDFSKLAKSGQTIMTPLPNSGTAQRMASQGITAALLGGGGGMVAGPMGLAAGLAGPALAGRTLMSRPVQAYLANQAAQPVSPQMRAIVNALLNSQASATAGRLAP